MKLKVKLFFAFLFFSITAFSANNELVPRKGLSPLDKAKTHEAEAKKWAKMGMVDGFEDEVSEDGTTYHSNSKQGYASLSSRSCTTNIGNVTTTRGISSGRYGPKNKNNNIIVVKGDVVSVCK